MFSFGKVSNQVRWDPDQRHLPERHFVTENGIGTVTVLALANIRPAKTKPRLLPARVCSVSSSERKVLIVQLNVILHGKSGPKGAIARQAKATSHNALPRQANRGGAWGYPTEMGRPNSNERAAPSARI